MSAHAKPPLLRLAFPPRIARVLAAAGAQLVGAEPPARCQVRDQIVHYDELKPGDLFLHDATFAVALEVTTYEDDYQGHKWMRTDVTYRYDTDRQFFSDFHADWHVAVRRYVEG
jgi:hypothetical protein